MKVPVRVPVLPLLLSGPSGLKLRSGMLSLCGLGVCSLFSSVSTDIYEICVLESREQRRQVGIRVSDGFEDTVLCCKQVRLLQY